VRAQQIRGIELGVLRDRRGQVLHRKALLAAPEVHQRPPQICHRGAASDLDRTAEALEGVLRPAELVQQLAPREPGSGVERIDAGRGLHLGQRLLPPSGPVVDLGATHMCQCQPRVPVDRPLEVGKCFSRFLPDGMDPGAVRIGFRTGWIIVDRAVHFAPCLVEPPERHERGGEIAARECV
jgi:hypothetical protein